jgi:hypothetical protein
MPAFIIYIPVNAGISLKVVLIFKGAKVVNYFNSLNREKGNCF